MSSMVLPVARSLFLCDAVTTTVAGKLHLANVFNSIRAAGFPHAGTRLAVFAQLSGAVGDIPTHVNVRHIARDEIVHYSGRFVAPFRDRVSVTRVSVVLAGCVFPHPGLYAVELFCHNQFVCDTTLLVHTGVPDDAT